MISLKARKYSVSWPIKRIAHQLNLLNDRQIHNCPFIGENIGVPK